MAMTLHICRNPVIKPPEKFLTLNIIAPSVADHMCYILRSAITDRTYIGYTVNFPRRIRQHNGEIVGGAKRTRKGRPWIPVCLIKGFFESSSALRFEYRLQHPHQRKKVKQANVAFTLETLAYVIHNGDGSIEKGNKMPWPYLTITWVEPNHYNIDHPNVTNIYN